MLKSLWNPFFIFILSLISTQAISAQVQSIDWTHGNSPIYQSTPDSKVLGHRWWLYSLQHGHQISFRFDISLDGKQGAWFGDVRAKQRLRLFDFHTYSSGKYGQNVKTNGYFAQGPDSEKGEWKVGESTQEIHLVEFAMDWVELVKLKNADTLMLRYLSVESPKTDQKSNFSLAQFEKKMAEIEKEISKHKGGRKFILTRKQVQAMPLRDLPPRIRQEISEGITESEKRLGVAVGELENYSMDQIKQKISDKKNADKKKAHQKIYDMEPKWLDMNVCPRPDVNYCKNTGKTAYEKSPLIGEPFRFGRIIGVIWRSKGSITKIYGGSIEFDIEPEIRRASEAEYYYLVENDKGYTSIVVADSVALKN